VEIHGVPGARLEDATLGADTGLKQHGGVGALVIGGDHPGLGVVRSLGSRGIPVYVLDDLLCVSKFSRYATRVIRVDHLRHEAAFIQAVLEVGQRFGQTGWVLIPTRDEHVAAIARHRDLLAKHFRVTTPSWETVQWAWNKQKTYALAQRLGLPVPNTWTVASAKELPSLYHHLPLAIKPAIKEKFFYATKAKAWRAETPEQLGWLFNKASAHVSTDEILIQEIIPGDGSQQYSFCALFKNGRTHSSLVACRHRQHPREFGRAATYVETTEVPLIEELAGVFLKSIDYYGPVEIEFKHDLRDGLYKLLDVNARIWGFHSLGMAAGVDFPYLLYADQVGLPLTGCRGRSGVGWVRAVTDIPTAFADMLGGHLSLGAYYQSLKRAKTESVFTRNDPLPALGEAALLPYLILKKYF
jgi:D-aspartate ligase